MMTTPAIDNVLHLPFDWHYCDPSWGQLGTALVFTTEPYWPDDPLGKDRQQCQVVCAVTDTETGRLAGQMPTCLAAFISRALNAYCATKDGLKDWKRLHSLMKQYARRLKKGRRQ